MSNFNDGCYSCTAGTELLAKVIAGKCQMHYTRAAVGCGEIPAGKKPEVMTEPADYVMDAMISSVSIPVDGQCQVTVQLNSKNVETGFLATCILLYAQDPDIGEVPYTYLVLENNPEWIKSADSDMAKLAVFDLATAVGSIENVSANIAPDAIITRSEVDEIAAQKVDKIPGKGLSTEDFTTAEKNKLAGIAAGATANIGTVTGIKMNGASKGSSGVVDLGTVITTHQDISGKVDKVSGKGLSTNDFTNADKNKLDSIESGAQVNTITGVKGNAESSYRTGDVNLTAENIGASPSDHTHYYAGSSTVGGAANSAVKLQTARTITLGGGLQGSTSFDGSSNITLNGSLKNCIVSSGNANVATYPWYKFAEATITDAYHNGTIKFLVSLSYNNGNVSSASGILAAHVRTESNRNINKNLTFLTWELAATGIGINDFVLVYTNTSNTSAKVELWLKLWLQYSSYCITAIQEFNSYSFENIWTLINTSGQGSANYTSGTGTVVSDIMSIKNPTSSA